MWRAGRPPSDRLQHLAQLLGDAGFEELGSKKWQAIVHEVVPAIKNAMMADYVVLGGGSVKRL
ncbi:MAG TPA: hypothetical protein PKE61_14785, partial [Burkholderiaceae bacterium]|nr:hypothetical protein [Burkholderiaceae bacterium]